MSTMFSKLAQYKNGNGKQSQAQEVEDIVHVDIDSMYEQEQLATVEEKEEVELKEVKSVEVVQDYSEEEHSVTEITPTEQFKKLTTQIKAGYNLDLFVASGKSTLRINYEQGALTITPHTGEPGQTYLKLDEGVLPVMPRIMQFDLANQVDTQPVRMTVEWSSNNSTPAQLVEIINSAFTSVGEAEDFRKRIASTTPLLKLAMGLGYKGSTEPSEIIDYVVIFLVDAASTKAKYSAFTKAVSDIYSEQFRKAFEF